MKNQYTQMFEKLIEKMKNALAQGNSDVIQSEYMLWLDFLRKINPESNLLKNEEDILLDIDFDKSIKHISNIRDIMIIAEEQKYPTWYIQPKFCDERFIFEYDEGQLKSTIENSLVQDIQTIRGFTGKISGQIHKSHFFACDVDRHTQFLKKIEYLQSFKLSVPEFVLFPTDKLPLITRDKLEMIFHNYVSKAQEQGLNVDGVVIVSDTPLFTEDQQTSSRKIAFTAG